MAERQLAGRGAEGQSATVRLIGARRPEPRIARGRSNRRPGAYRLLVVDTTAVPNLSGKRITIPSAKVEFGYSVGVSRPIGILANATSCHFCAENFIVGVEAYGGLGSAEASGRANGVTTLRLSSDGA